jgi:hypothetical protein
MASTRSSRRATERATFRRGPARVPGLSRWRAAWLVMAASLAAPVAAQERPQEDRVEVFRNLPYWPGYWVAEDQTDVPISGIPVRDETTPPPRNDALGMWAAQIPWNDEGRRRVEEVSRTMGGRKSLGWGYPLMMASATPLLFLITPEHVLPTTRPGTSTPTAAGIRPPRTCGRPLPAIRSATGKARRWSSTR